MDRRAKRSQNPDEALQFLIEAVADRSEVRAVALVNARGRLLAGTGSPRDLTGLARISGPAARGGDCPEFEEVTRDTDLFSRAVTVHASTVYLSALGTRIRKMQDAVNGIGRIVSGR